MGNRSILAAFLAALKQAGVRQERRRDCHGGYTVVAGAELTQCHLMTLHERSIDLADCYIDIAILFISTWYQKSLK